MELIDTHTHLTEDALFSRLDAVRMRARACGVAWCLVPTYTAETHVTARRLAHTYDGIVWAAGVHPLFPDLQACETIPSFCTDALCVAIGECGLDYVSPDADKTLQRTLFERHCTYASTYDMPLLIHCRKAYDDLLSVLREGPALRGVLHSCSCSVEQIDPFLSYGLYVGFSGVVTRPNAKKARRLAAYVPLDRMLLETDSPFIGAGDHPPPLSEPADTLSVAQAIADVRGVSLDEIATHTTRNAHTLFHLHTTVSDADA